MSVAKSSGINLSENYFLRNFYSGNPSVSKRANRKAYASSELNFEDSRALKKSLRRLSSFEFNENDNIVNVVNSVKAYVETYNNTVDSASSEKALRRYAKQFKQLSADFENELSTIGISVDNSGKLTVNENLLNKMTGDKIGHVFSSKSDFHLRSSSLSTKMYRASLSNLYESVTGAGGNLNIKI